MAHADELGLGYHDDPVGRPYMADRLRPEAACLRYLADHTTIPRPD